MRADKSQQVAPAHTCSAAARGTASMGSSSSSSPLLRAGGKVWICCYFLSVIAAPYRFALVCVPALRAPRVSLLAAWKSPLFFSHLIFSPMLELSQPRGGQCSSFWGCRGVGLVVWLRGALVLTPSLRPPQCWHAVAHLNASSYSRCDSENETPCYHGRKKREREQEGGGRRVNRRAEDLGAERFWALPIAVKPASVIQF